MSTSLPDIGHVTTSQVDGLEIRSELKSGQALPMPITDKTTAEKRRMDNVRAGCEQIRLI